MKNGWYIEEPGVNVHYENDKIHRDDGPAVTYDPTHKFYKKEYYYKFGKITKIIHTSGVVQEL